MNTCCLFGMCTTGTPFDKRFACSSEKVELYRNRTC
nr:MAG TPA: hypothetical protein [Caudoviricetes sp.]